jgi:hypothetical protein
MCSLVGHCQRFGGVSAGKQPFLPLKMEAVGHQITSSFLGTHILISIYVTKQFVSSDKAFF